MAGKRERPEEREASKKWAPNHKEQSPGSSPHSLWHACLVPGLLACPSGAMLESWGHTHQKPVKDGSEHHRQVVVI